MLSQLPAKNSRTCNKIKTNQTVTSHLFQMLKGFLHIFFNIFLRLPKEHFIVKEKNLYCTLMCKKNLLHSTNPTKRLSFTLNPLTVNGHYSGHCVMSSILPLATIMAIAKSHPICHMAIIMAIMFIFLCFVFLKFSLFFFCRFPSFFLLSLLLQFYLVLYILFFCFTIN